LHKYRREKPKYPKKLVLQPKKREGAGSQFWKFGVVPRELENFEKSEI